MRAMRIFHIATLDDWKQAQESGTYATSTYGRTLEQEGFIHAAYHDQVPGVRDRHYAHVAEPLVVLEIESDLLGAEVRDEPVGDLRFPHVYGTIPTSAVVAWRPARLPPIDLGTRREAAPPPPLLTVAFRGVAMVLAAGAVAAFAAAALAQSRTDDGELPNGAAFVLWSLMVILAVLALGGLTYAEWARRRPTRGS